MTDDTTSSPPREAILVAQLLNTTSEQVTAVKLIPGDHIDPNADLAGVTSIEERLVEVDVDAADQDGLRKRRLNLYHTPHGQLVSVEHESGEEIYAVLSAAADAAEVLKFIAALIGCAKQQRSYPPSHGETVSQRIYTADGYVQTTQALDEDQPLDGQLTAVPGSPGP